MCETYEQEQSGSVQDKTEEDPAEIYKVRPPNKKKYEEEMDKLLSQIKEKEAEMERLKSLGSLNVTGELQRIKAEKSAAIAKRKKIDQELERIKKIIPDKMRQLVQLESSLIYKSEDKINTAVQRLEWNLKVQPFKLMEEKKIVSEIDRLKRSKKTLVQYMALKQDISGIRDMQRRMREERDMYFQAVGKLNAEEDRLRRDMISAKTTLSVLKYQIDELHENKRQLVASHKKQMEEFQGAKEKLRKGSWKKREDYKKPVISERRQQTMDLEVEKSPHDKYISWCNSLIKVLSRYNKLSTQEPSPESLSPASSVEEPELADEIDDGQYVLLKKPDDGLENAAGARRPNKKNRRLRKQSSMKKVTLCPDMVQQLTELGLKAPNSMSEVAEAIESLRLKKILLEQEQHASEVASDAGISATESLICEMSRQVSKTESFEGTVDTNLGDQVYAEILHGCSDEPEDQAEGWEEDSGAVGGCEEVDILSPNSDSTVEGDTGSVESQSCVCDDSNNIRHLVAKSEKVLSLEASESEHRQDKLKTFCMPSDQGQISGIKMSADVACSIPPSSGGSMENICCSVSNSDGSVENVECSTPHSDGSNIYCSIPSSDGSIENIDCSLSHRSGSIANVDCSISHRDMSLEYADFLSKPKHGETSEEVDPATEKNLSLCTPLCSVTGHQVVPLTSSDFPALALKHATPPVNSSLPSNRSIWRLPLDQFRPVNSAGCVVPASSLIKPQETCTAKYLASSGQARSPATPAPQSLSGLKLDDGGFPSLSESLNRPRRGSNISTRSSGRSSPQTEHLSHPCHPRSGIGSTNQITGCNGPDQVSINPAQAGSNAAQAGMNAAQSGTNAAQAGMNTALAGTNAAQAGTNAAQAGTNAAQAGTNAAQAGTDAAQAGTNPAQAGTNPAQAGTNPAQAGMNAAQAGTNAAQANTKTVFQVPESCQSLMIHENPSIHEPPVTSQKCPEVLSHCDRLSMSQIPSMDMSSTEKWVESSVAYIKDLIPDPCMDRVPAAVTESTRL